MDVPYLDAIFNPNIYKSRHIFPHYPEAVATAGGQADLIL